MNITNVLIQNVLNTISRMLLRAYGQDGQVYVDAKMFVATVAEQAISSEEKHRRVKQLLMELFKTVGSTILDIIIKLAYLHLQTEVK